MQDYLAMSHAHLISATPLPQFHFRTYGGSNVGFPYTPQTHVFTSRYESTRYLGLTREDVKCGSSENGISKIQ